MWVHLPDRAQQALRELEGAVSPAMMAAGVHTNNPLFVLAHEINASRASGVASAPTHDGDNTGQRLERDAMSYALRLARTKAPHRTALFATKAVPKIEGLATIYAGAAGNVRASSRTATHCMVLADRGDVLFEIIVDFLHRERNPPDPDAIDRARLN